MADASPKATSIERTREAPHVAREAAKRAVEEAPRTGDVSTNMFDADGVITMSDNIDEG
ncbi:hypothetical protein ABZS76_32775 [Streptomyces sp. NPDC005562]|uniref:hypothetical protein n=1 Tax=Streptomyces sp. NPDC005562 TaxID=3154890 RepID=UPI0033BBC8E9